MQNKQLSNRELFLILIISFLFFSFKWILSFYIFSSEDLLIKTINDSSYSEETFDSYTYFHYVKSLSEFDFTSLYNKMLSTNYLITPPYGSIIVHSLLFKSIGIMGFILSEYLFITFFFILFFLIFRLIGLSKNISLLLPVVCFVSPLIFKNFNYFGIIEFKTLLDVFYGLRFPRPLVVNIYFYFFIYVLLKSHLNKTFFSAVNLYIFTTLLALTASSFFFFFINMFLCLLFYSLNEYRLELIGKVKENIIKIFFSTIIFLIIISPFIFLTLNSNPDYMQRMGVYKIDYADKIFLISHYFEKIFRIKYVILYIFLFLSYIFMKKYNKENYKYVHIFYILFFTSLLAPIIFISFSGKIAFLMHFNNMVVLNTGILLMILIIINLKNFFSFLKFKINESFILFLIIPFIIIYFFNTYKEHFNRLNEHERIDRDKIVKLILKNTGKQKSNILTFDRKIMTWSILKGNYDLFLVDGSFSQRSNAEIENDLIRSFKLMNLSKSDFKNFISNRKIGFRYNNPELKMFFWQRYTANSSYTFNKTKDFEKEIIEFINQSSPYYLHQFAVPNFEIKRLLDKFVFFDTKILYFPDYIIINKNMTLSPIFKNIDISEKYCLGYKGKSLDIYLLKKLCI